MVAAVCALRQYWPQTRIVWVIGRVEYALVAGMEGVEFVVYDKKSGYRGLIALGQKLAKERFDLLLHMQVALRASLLSLFIKAPLRLGFDRARAHDFQWLFTNAKIAPHPKAHVLEGFFDFLKALGVPDRKPVWAVPVPLQNEAEAAALVDKPFFIISPCSSDRKRNWRNWTREGYAQVAAYVHRRYGLVPVVTGGGRAIERDYARAIADLSGVPVLDLVGKTGLKTLLALMKRSAFVLGPDSGPIHMAAVAGVPAVGLYAGSNPLRTGPYLSLNWTVNRYPDAVERYLRKSVDEVRWGGRVRDDRVMELIAVQDVTEKIDTLMKAREA
ncbi:MAG: glycosyltransferase family 9 protein [Campylobacterales bacterium]